MAFLDDLGKKISQAGQNAVQKTKDMTETARIKSLISEEEKTLNNHYYRIGKLYVAKHLEDFESDFSDLISEVWKSETKIRDYRKQLQDIKGVIRCEKCGAEIANNINFCNSCGAPISKSAPVTDENSIRCTSCGQVVSKDIKFCTFCGNPMSEESPLTRKCPNCGANITDELAFCTECGIKLS